MVRSNEKGIAMILALFLVLAASVLGSSLIFVSQTETMSSMNYRLMSQARYGAESGVHKAANYLLNTYAPPGTVGDPLANYVTTVSPVTYNGNPVVLSSDPAVASNYPVAAIRTAFLAAAQGTLDVNVGAVTYTAHATLRSMRQITDVYSGATVTLQTWDITGDGTIGVTRPAQVEVVATIERQTMPVYSYAAFATNNGCGALSFAGGATTNSYDSTAPLVGGVPPTVNSGGNVGTNGNLTDVGNTTDINGTLSTPRTGVGACTNTNVTAETLGNGATVSGGLNQLSQAVSYPTPATPNPLPPLTAQQFHQNGGCPAGVANCTVSPNGATITPLPGTVETLGDVTFNGNAVLHLRAGTYVINSLTQNGNSQIVIDSGPVVIQIAGKDSSGGNLATPLMINGNGISNPSYSPNNLEIIYAGTGQLQLAGGDTTSALVYAPNATATFSGGADLYGAVLHYDRHLQTSAVTAGNYMMSTFTWKSY
ncbi:MAG: hypothetical protein DMF89_12005 [Acidobacteria bacterium]|nr:MAG: hypothetical protein DMF89_12005 [Acidobacteriota bacterium]